MGINYMETVTCEYCGKTLPKSEAIEGEYFNIYACPDCAKEHLVYCERCGEVMDRENANNGFGGYLCEYCHDDLFG